MIRRLLLTVILITLVLPSCIALRDDVKRDVATAKLQIEADTDAKFKTLRDDLKTQISSLEKRISSLEESLKRWA